MEIEINYSFIIPHRNVPHLLQRCIDSIPKRDDIQIIIVDDNSSVHYVEGCTAPTYSDSSLHAAVVEIYVGKNS